MSATDKSARSRGSQGEIGHLSWVIVRPGSRGPSSRWPRPARTSACGPDLSPIRPRWPENHEDPMTTVPTPHTPPAPAGTAATAGPAVSPAASPAPSPAAVGRRLSVVADQKPNPPAPAGCNSSSPSTDVPGEASRPRRKAAAKAGADIRGDVLLTLAQLRLATPPASCRSSCCRTSRAPTMYAGRCATCRANPRLWSAGPTAPSRATGTARRRVSLKPRLPVSSRRRSAGPRAGARPARPACGSTASPWSTPSSPSTTRR